MTSQVLHHVRAVVLLGRRSAIALTRVAVVGHDKEIVWELRVWCWRWWTVPRQDAEEATQRVSKRDFGRRLNLGRGAGPGASSYRQVGLC
jgi:hypothetical protein